MTPQTVPNLAGQPRPVEATRVIAGVLHAAYREWPGAKFWSYKPVGDPTRPVAEPGRRDVYR